MWRFGLLIVVSVLLVGCGSSPASTHATAAAAGGDSPFDPLPPGITVRDAYTPVLAQVNNPPTIPVAGTDGKFHVAYNLVLQNASQVPATIRKLEVVDATNTRKVLATFSDRQLVDPACNFGDCNRLRALPAAPVKDTVIPPQQARVLFVDYSFGSSAKAPKYVMHHLYLDGTAILDGQNTNAPGVLPAEDPVLGPKLTVDNVDGNHIVLNIGNGAYAFYAHLIKGSLRVKIGDKVTKGQVIAKLGNTGNANASHLHFQVMNGPSAIASPSIPYVIDSFDYQGQISPS